MSSAVVPAFPFHQLEGPPREVGLQHGQLLGEKIAAGVEFYRARFAAETSLSWPEILRLTEGVGTLLRTHAPDLLAEMDGIAEGSEQPVEAILAINARTGLLRTPSVQNEEAQPEAECTTAACLPEATRDGNTILCGNWDQNAHCLQTTVVLEIRTPDRPAVLLFTEAGILMRTGLNDAGIGITGNSLTSHLDSTSNAQGIPWSVLRRKVLQNAGFAAAVREVYRAPRPHSGNHLVATAEGFAVDLEATPQDVYAIVPTDGIVAHSNHFVSPAALANIQDRGIGNSPSSLYRLERLEQALRSQRGQVTVEVAQQALQDHLGKPDSVCCHTDPPGGRNSCTIVSHITDLDARTLTISAGPPCSSEYSRYSLSN